MVTVKLSAKKLILEIEKTEYIALLISTPPIILMSMDIHIGASAYT